MSPLGCHGLHDLSNPYIKRIQKGKVVIVKLVQDCLACGQEFESFAPAPKIPLSERIKSYD